jgi:hypothetical protein
MVSSQNLNSSVNFIIRQQYRANRNGEGKKPIERNVSYPQSNNHIELKETTEIQNEVEFDISTSPQHTINFFVFNFLMSVIGGRLRMVSFEVFLSNL